jgi:hypothetical protein
LASLVFEAAIRPNILTLFSEGKEDTSERPGEISGKKCKPPQNAPAACPRETHSIQLQPTGTKMGRKYEVEITGLQCDLLQLFRNCIEKL